MHVCMQVPLCIKLTYVTYGQTYALTFTVHTVPLNLKLMLTIIYSRALTPFYQAGSGCSRASATCSHA